MIRINSVTIAGILCFVLTLVRPESGRAQQVGGADPLLHFPSRSLRLDSLGSQLERQTGLILSFNATLIDPGKTILLPARAIPLTGLMSYLKKRYHLLGKRYGNHLVIRSVVPSPSGRTRTKAPGTAAAPATDPGKRNEKAEVEKEKRNAAPRVQRREAGPLPALSGLPPRWAPEERAPVVAPSPALPRSPGRARHLSAAGTSSIQAPRNTGPVASRREPPQAPRRETSLIEGGWLLSAGLSGDELMYLRPGVRAGVPWLFGILSWQTNWRVSGLSYGIGSSLRLGEQWRAQVTATTGQLSRHFQWKPTDSTEGSFRIKGRLTRISVLAERTIGTHVTVTFGPTINFLKSVYRPDIDANGDTSALPARPQMQSTYHLLKPLYTLSDQYGPDNTVNKKRWIGLELGVYYRFR